MTAEEQKGNSAPEAWAAVPSMRSGNFEISTYGRLRVRTEIAPHRTRWETLPPKLFGGELAIRTDHNGGFGGWISLGRLVLSVFGPAQPTHTCRHAYRDRNCKNLSINNLYWIETEEYAP